MNARLPLTDEMIRAACIRRVTGASSGDVRERVLAATAVASQRRGWRMRMAPVDVLRQRRATLMLAVAVVLLLAAALFVVIVGSWTNQPDLGSLGRLAYVSDGDLYVAGPDGASPILIWDLAAAEDLRGSQLVWVDPTTVLLHNWQTEPGVVLVDVASRARRLLDTGELLAISPDHTQVATVGYREGDAAPRHMRILDVASGSLVAEFAAPLQAYPQSWSPDGRWLLGQTQDSVYKVDVASGAVTVLATGLCCGLSIYSTAWSPDGTRIVYVDYHTAASRSVFASPSPLDCPFRCGTIWMLDAAGGTPTRVTAELGSEIAPAFSPDGLWIAYIEEDPGGVTQRNNLVIVAAEGTGRRVLTPSPEVPLIYLGEALHGQRFAWDPDSGGLSYLSFGDLWHITLDGQASRIDTPAISEFARQGVP